MKTCLLAADRWQLLITAVVALLFTLKGGAVKCEFLAKKKIRVENNFQKHYCSVTRARI